MFTKQMSFYILFPFVFISYQPNVYTVTDVTSLCQQHPVMVGWQISRSTQCCTIRSRVNCYSYYISIKQYRVRVVYYVSAETTDLKVNRVHWQHFLWCLPPSSTIAVAWFFFILLRWHHLGNEYQNSINTFPVITMTSSIFLGVVYSEYADNAQ
jgi:hypothetical protein